jgi:hypothetical protein
VTAFAGGERRHHAERAPGCTAPAAAATQRVSGSEPAQRRVHRERGVDWRVLELGAAVAHDAIWFPARAVLASNLATDQIAGR